MGKTILITQSNYIPWKGYFDLINSADEFVLYDDMQYSRRDWRNRNKIKTAQGLAWLTIPVMVKGRFSQKISETKISDPIWAEKHWQSIKQNYSRAPYFSKYGPVLEEAFSGCSSDSLSLVNYALLKCLCDILKIRTTFRWSSEFVLAEDRTERLIQICSGLKGTKYITGPSAKAYMNEALFAEAGLAIEYFNYSEYPTYSQLYGEFVHDVSVIDLIFNEGENSSKYMKTFGCCS